MLDSLKKCYRAAGSTAASENALAVTLRYRAGCEEWAEPLAQAIRQHPQLKLVCHQLPDAGDATSATPSPLPGVVLGLLGTSRFPEDHYTARALLDRGDRAVPDVLIDCCIGAPVFDRGTAVHHWHIDPSRIRADADAALLGALHLAPVILRGIGMDGKPHIVATHALATQTFAPSERRIAAKAALPMTCLSVLVRIANSCSLRKPDLALVSRIEQLNEVSLQRRLLYSALLLFKRYRTSCLRKLTQPHWEIAAVPESSPSVATLLERPVANYTSVFGADEKLRADPHALVTEQGVRVWYETMRHSDTHADIRSALLSPSAKAIEEQTVLSGDHHFSYPFVFEHDGARWMIPETGAADRIELRRQDAASGQWPVHTVLIDNINATDTTVFHHQGRWWMFTNLMSHRAVDERDLLVLFWADALTGPWQPHQLNPVLTGVDKARMAGPVFQDGDTLVRPSQYGGVRYGHGINLCSIDALTPDTYEETHLGRILPTSRSRWLGCHTLHIGTGVTLIDRMRRRMGRRMGSDHAKSLIRRTLTPKKP